MSSAAIRRYISVSVVIVAVILPTVLLGQITFEKTYGGSNDEYGWCAQPTPDDGYIIVGSTRSFGNGGDVYLIKTDSLGDTLWTRTYDNGGGDIGLWVEQTGDGGYIISGASGWPLYLIKTDSLGNVVWENTYDGTGCGYCVREVSDGGFVVVGSWGNRTFLVKTNSLGGLVWLRIYGGGWEDDGRSVCESPDGGYAIVGYTFNYMTGCSTDVTMIKVNSNGDSLWGRRYGGLLDDWGYSVQSTADGGYIIVGVTRSFSLHGYDDVYVIKTDSLGWSQWSGPYGGPFIDFGTSVDVTSDGGYIVGGFTGSIGAGGWDFYLLKLDSLGDSIWATAYGGTDRDRGNCVREASDGGYIIVGSTYSFGAGLHDIYLVKTDGNGEVGITEEDPKTRAESKGFFFPQNHPNPFHHSTLISYSLPITTQVNLTIHDITGRLVETLANETKQPGIHNVRWNRRTNSSGVYFYRLKVGEFVATRKMVVL